MTNAIANVIGSASKIVFILMAASTVALTFAGKVDPKDFMLLASMAFSFYFTTKANPVSDPSAGGTPLETK